MQNASNALERFVVLLYDKNSDQKEVNDCRRELFCKGRSIEKIPPTSAALKKHILQASYVAGHVWGSMLVGKQNLPDPQYWGWKLNGKELSADWSDLPEAAMAIRGLIKYGCNP